MMIGVACKGAEECWVREFFELFKTPWEFYRSDRKYPVVVSTLTDPGDVQAKLLVLYSSDSGKDNVQASESHESTLLDYRETVFPVYGKVSTFKSAHPPLIRVHGSALAAAVEVADPKKKVLRVGYDLFDEIRILLSSGQPVANALTPTLEIHISMLRDWILAAGIPVVEVPAVPAGYEFIACLTHDVDFIRIRDHKFDHTMWGFVYRSSLGSFMRLAKGKISWRHFVRNVKALVSLPAVHLGICEDFWQQDFERFVSLEHDLKATFFFIPFKDRPGNKVKRRYAKRRAATYDVIKEKGLVRELARGGNEIGVHGIDAWHDAEKGSEEYSRIVEASGKSRLGVRMHWLCFDTGSARILEQAGFQYDSTIGYNEAVGYRAGTSQAFLPEGAKTLLELPLHIQDTALFYSGYLGLGESGAWKRCEILLKNASTFGGVLTVLWHTRSLAPERLWGAFYSRLLQALRARPVWFATAGQAVEWFRKRRTLCFRHADYSGRRVRLIMECKSSGIDNQPGLMVRVHMPRPDTACNDSRTIIDVPWSGEAVVEIPIA